MKLTTGSTAIRLIQSSQADLGEPHHPVQHSHCCLAEADVRARTNCTVIAAEHDGTLITVVGPDFGVQMDDTLVAGLDSDARLENWSVES